MLNFIMELLYNRSFVLKTADGQISRPHPLKNGVAQGSVLVLTLHNVYTHNIPQTNVNRDMYADYIALVVPGLLSSKSRNC